MDLLFVSATPFEIAPLQTHLQGHFWAHADDHFQNESLHVKTLVTGVGMAYTALHLGQMLPRRKFDLVINAGLAGAFNRSLKIGEVVQVVSERFADLGVENADGSFTDVHEMGLIGSNDPPFLQGVLSNGKAAEFEFLPPCRGLTVNKVHGSQASISAIQEKYDADVESMEGAAFFLACLQAGVPFLEIRSISNYVEPRNRNNWDLPLAIENLNKVLIELLQVFSTAEQ